MLPHATRAPAPVSPAKGRYHELDVMKAVAIVAVVGTHSLAEFWSPTYTRLNAFAGQSLRFAVPTFLAVSGFLYYSSVAIPLGTIRRRLRRLLPPYFCVSLAAYAYTRGGPDHLPLLHALLFGAAFGPYYYVLILVEFVLASWLLSRLPHWATIALALLAAGFTAYSDVIEGHIWSSFFWMYRTPYMWAIWFMMGWLAAMFRPVVFTFALRYRSALIVAWTGILCAWTAVFWSTVEGGVWLRLISVLLIAGNIVGLFALARGLERVPAWVVTLSEWTYAIYLLHLFFIHAIRDYLQPVLTLPGVVWVPLQWVCGLGGALAIIVVFRAVLGERSRDIIGA